ncbi:MAG: hypothetical protein J0H67_15445 [Rhodospirillales bacterium]|nr:hypothetical protein [Rhodospirillales bacterium]
MTDSSGPRQRGITRHCRRGLPFRSSAVAVLGAGLLSASAGWTQAVAQESADPKVARESVDPKVVQSSLDPKVTQGSADPSVAQDSADPQWRFYLTPYLWIAGVSGSAQTPISRLPTRDVSVSFGDVLSNLGAIPLMGAGEARNGRFGVLIDFMALSVKSDVSTNGPLYSGGNVRMTQITGTVMGMYRAVETNNQFLDVGAGVRPWSVSTKFTLNAGLLPGVSTSQSVSWADPLIAARYHADISKTLGLTVYGDVGGFGAGSELTWQVLGTVDYRWNDWLVTRLGYRHLHIDYQASVLRLNIGLSGPILAATFRF